MNAYDEALEGSAPSHGVCLSVLNYPCSSVGPAKSLEPAEIPPSQLSKEDLAEHKKIAKEYR